MAAPPQRPAGTPHLGMLGPRAAISNDRTRGTIQAPSATTAGAELTTESYTFFAKPSSTPVVLYNADRQYAQVTLTLQTAGPVAVSTKQQILPVLSGKASLLQTGVPTRFTLAKGQKLYVASTTVSPISVTIQPFAWMEQILGSIIGTAK